MHFLEWQQCKTTYHQKKYLKIEINRQCSFYILRTLQNYQPFKYWSFNDHNFDNTVQKCQNRGWVIATNLQTLSINNEI